MPNVRNSLAADSRPDLGSMDLAELEAALEARGHPRFHGRQIFSWIYAKGVADFEKMTDLSRPLRADLAEHFRISTPTVIARETSSDGTVKFLLGLEDNRRIESVFIPDTPSQTFCISTQVGCAMKCGFCLTGKMGLVRNLSAGEIAGQVRVLAGELGLRDSKFNIVLMGMGEPLHNYDNTMKALRMLNDEHGLAVSPKRVTLSTVGVLPALDRLATEPLMPNLAISLHATTEDQRDALVPVNRKYGLEDILAAARKFPARRRNRITFEYVLLEWSQRHAGRRAAPRAAARQYPLQSEPDSAERSGGHRVRAPVGRSGQRVRANPRAGGADGVGAQESRPRHPSRVRSVDCGRDDEVDGPESGGVALDHGSNQRTISARRERRSPIRS